jgi:hypothetical protein
MTTVNNLYADIDLYGKEASPGVALEYFDIKAISNALTLWLTSKKGDFIRNPGAGGILDKYLFKTMDNSHLFKIKLELISSFEDYFSDSLALDEVVFNPDYKNKILEIKVYYHDIRTGVSDNVVAYVNSNFAYKRFEYETVEYTDENLYRFVQITISSYSVEKLIYDTDMLKWRWGKYIFSNFSYTDTYFSQILALING